MTDALNRGGRDEKLVAKLDDRIMNTKTCFIVYLTLLLSMLLSIHVLCDNNCYISQYLQLSTSIPKYVRV